MTDNLDDLQAEVEAVRIAIEQADKTEGWSGNWVGVASCAPEAVVAALAEPLRAGKARDNEIKQLAERVLNWDAQALPEAQERITALEAERERHEQDDKKLAADVKKRIRWLEAENERLKEQNDGLYEAVKLAKNEQDRLRQGQKLVETAQGELEAENAKLREAIENHVCAPVFTASDGMPGIRVGNEAELREALANTELASQAVHALKRQESPGERLPCGCPDMSDWEWLDPCPGHVWTHYHPSMVDALTEYRFCFYCGVMEQQSLSEHS